MYRKWQYTSMYRTALTICTAQWSPLYLPHSGHYIYRTVVTICSASGHYMYRQFNIQQFYFLPTHCIATFIHNPGTTLQLMMTFLALWPYHDRKVNEVNPKITSWQTSVRRFCGVYKLPLHLTLKWTKLLPSIVATKDTDVSCTECNSSTTKYRPFAVTNTI